MVAYRLEDPMAMNDKLTNLFFITRRNDLRTDRPEVSVATTSSKRERATMMKSKMFQPSWK